MKKSMKRITTFVSSIKDLDISDKERFKKYSKNGNIDISEEKIMIFVTDYSVHFYLKEEGIFYHLERQEF